MNPSPRPRFATLALAVLPIAALFVAVASARQSTPPTTVVQEYRVLEPNDLRFRTPDLAEAYMNNLGSHGWIFPAGTEVQAITFDPGLANQNTLFIIRPGGPYDESRSYVTIRRTVAN